MSSNSLSKGVVPRARQAGFTLLEVMISLVILSFIALGIYQATVQTFKLRDVLQSEGEFYNGIRLAMDILQRDIALCYSPLIMRPKKAPSTTAPQPGATPELTGPEADVTPDLDPQTAQAFASKGLLNESKFWGPVLDKTGIRASRFQGSENKMSFVAASHVRIYKDAAESEFAKVSFELAPDSSNHDVQGAQLLVKTESPNVYEEEDTKDKYLRKFVLLKGIRKFRFRYFRKDKGPEGTWMTTWDSNNGDQKGRYPDEVEITLDVGGPLRLGFDGKYVFRMEVPLSGVDPST